MRFSARSSTWANSPLRVNLISLRLDLQRSRFCNNLDDRKLKDSVHVDVWTESVSVLTLDAIG